MRGYRILCSPDIPKDCVQNAEGKSETDPILQDAPLLSIHVKVSILRILILHFQFPPVAKTYFLGKKKREKLEENLVESKSIWEYAAQMPRHQQKDCAERSSFHK